MTFKKIDIASVFGANTPQRSGYEKQIPLFPTGRDYASRLVNILEKGYSKSVYALKDLKETASEYIRENIHLSRTELKPVSSPYKLSQQYL